MNNINNLNNPNYNINFTYNPQAIPGYMQTPFFYANLMENQPQHPQVNFMPYNPQILNVCEYILIVP
jgi:hypothetical protein